MTKPRRSGAKSGQIYGRLTNRSSALITTAVTVVPSVCALSMAACQSSSGTRTARGALGIGRSQRHRGINSTCNFGLAVFNNFLNALPFLESQGDRVVRIVHNSSPLNECMCSVGAYRLGADGAQVRCGKRHGVNDDLRPIAELSVDIAHRRRVTDCGDVVGLSGAFDSNLVGAHGVSLAGVCIYRLCPSVYTCQAHFENNLGRVA